MVLNGKVLGIFINCLSVCTTPFIVGLLTNPFIAASNVSGYSLPPSVPTFIDAISLNLSPS